MLKTLNFKNYRKIVKYFPITAKTFVAGDEGISERNTSNEGSHFLNFKHFVFSVLKCFKEYYFIFFSPPSPYANHFFLHKLGISL